MDALFLNELFWGLGAALAGGIIFSGIGLISGTDETATIAPLTLLVILLGFPPVAVFAWFIAAAVSKHMTHAIPTALMGVPGDTMAVPMLQDASILRRLGVPHIALRKMISGGIIAAFVALPISVGFATLLAPFAEAVKSWAPIIFTIAAVIIAYTSGGKWASVFVLIPFAFLIQGLNKMAIAALGKGVFISIFLGIAIGPMFADLVTLLSPISRHLLTRSQPREFWLAPELKSWKGYFPNPLAILSGEQKMYTAAAATVSALTFTFSPVGMTVMVGEIISSRVKSLYQRLTTSLAAMNGVTEATYIAETIIPLMAFGIPLSPMALGPAAPLFNAPPVFTSQPIHNLHNLMVPYQYLLYGFIGIIVASLVAYPFSMNYARKASVWVLQTVSQEAIISMFTGLIIVLSYYEAGIVGIGISITIAILGGILNRFFGIHTGVQYMTYYASSYIVLTLFGIK
ncbi:tripartite tricarboxylate transporter TctA family protein [Anaerospora hongkongensis]|uniref:Tripartite tricarboxylate transporter TctA family protein n=1 Tax=Anaerospora hongkongensis TaxID=244830 RepID=A0A4R1Q7H6_9FIRM|nr:tripartite tricarboxylate transporter permease [Anaerospora hongkongensis]TCL37350.1 tripartite tricarboxylate transporter TctA family protein [Anaerospora hongkongensis]